MERVRPELAYVALRLAGDLGDFAGIQSFERTFQTPFRADSDAVKASFSRSVLKGEVPKPADVKKACKKIEVKAA